MRAKHSILKSSWLSIKGVRITQTRYLRSALNKLLRIPRISVCVFDAKS